MYIYIYIDHAFQRYETTTRLSPQDLEETKLLCTELVKSSCSAFHDLQLFSKLQVAISEVLPHPATHHEIYGNLTSSFHPLPNFPEKKITKPTSTGIRLILSFGNKKPTSQQSFIVSLSRFSQEKRGKVGIKGGKTQLVGSVGSSRIAGGHHCLIHASSVCRFASRANPAGSCTKEVEASRALPAPMGEEATCSKKHQ